MFSLEEKIGQMLVVGFHGLKPPDHILQWLTEGRIGGVILFARNIDTSEQVAELTNACHEAASRPILIAIDQEGGIVARLREGFTESPGAMALGVADSEELAMDVASVLANEMRALAINWNLAPAIDLTHNIHNPSVGVRSLGCDPERVKALAVAQVNGFQGVGVASTAKHFPGKANTPVDPHVSLPVINGPVDDMWDTDLVPFRAVSEAGIAAMLITHVQFKALEPEFPSTLSPRIIRGLLRGEIGFEGVVTTDCMEMKAVTNKYGPRESAVLAAIAGANIILFSHTQEFQIEAYNALLEAARTGRLPMEKIDYSINKIQSMKKRFSITHQPSFDVIRHHRSLAVMKKAARAGTVLLRCEPDVLPLKLDDPRQLTLIEFASHLEIDALDQRGQAWFASNLNEKLPLLKTVGLNPNTPSEETLLHARELVYAGDLVVVATRNAHLIPRQRELANEFIDAAKKSILLCLRNPYDAGVITEVNTVLCTCGDSRPSLEAAADALVGIFTPDGRLPVPLTMG
ncbi:MAG: glycoside hydrolase family 3 protein [Candidatus Bathyarchaeota archaeon]|nr:glycoside hydrolase family 3 protein [Candidatus Bathyarchaeota archaeon]